MTNVTLWVLPVSYRRYSLGPTEVNINMLLSQGCHLIGDECNEWRYDKRYSLGPTSLTDCGKLITMVRQAVNINMLLSQGCYLIGDERNEWRLQTAKS
jgi:hypothetical protein